MLSWVVVLAGYKPTPAEEMDEEREETPQAEEKKLPNGNGHTKPEPAPAAAPQPSGNIISEPQAKRFYAIWRGRNAAGWDQNTIQRLLNDHAIASDRAIPKQHYDALVKIVQTLTFNEYLDMSKSA